MRSLLSVNEHFKLKADAKIANKTMQNPNFLSEGVIFGAKSKLTRMGVYLVYIPIRGNELGAEDDPLSQERTQFLVRRLHIQRSAKLAAMGCTWAYCPLQTYFVSGSRCLPYHKKLLALNFYLLVSLNNITNLNIVV